MFDALVIGALLGIGLGLLIAVCAFAVLLKQIANAPERVRALGFVYLGMATVVASASLYPMSLIGQDRLPLWGGIPAIMLVLYSAWRLRRSASATFAEYRAMNSSERSSTEDTI